MRNPVVNNLALAIVHILHVQFSQGTINMLWHFTVGLSFGCYAKMIVEILDFGDQFNTILKIQQWVYVTTYSREGVCSGSSLTSMMM